VILIEPILADSTEAAISALGAVAVAGITYVTTRSGASGTIRQRREGLPSPQDAGFSITSVRGHPEPVLPSLTPKQWTVRKWLWRAAAIVLVVLPVVARTRQTGQSVRRRLFSSCPVGRHTTSPAVH
jgi:hypothetical protein